MAEFGIDVNGNGMEFLLTDLENTRLDEIQNRAQDMVKDKDAVEILRNLKTGISVADMTQEAKTAIIGPPSYKSKLTALGASILVRHLRVKGVRRMTEKQSST